jgi:hypothetical protein
MVRRGHQRDEAILERHEVVTGALKGTPLVDGVASDATGTPFIKQTFAVVGRASTAGEESLKKRVSRG